MISEIRSVCYHVLYNKWLMKARIKRPSRNYIEVPSKFFCKDFNMAHSNAHLWYGVDNQVSYKTDIFVELYVDIERLYMFV